MTQKLDLELVQGLWAFLDQLVFVKSFFVSLRVILKAIKRPFLPKPTRKENCDKTPTNFAGSAQWIALLLSNQQPRVRFSASALRFIDSAAA